MNDNIIKINSPIGLLISCTPTSVRDHTYMTSTKRGVH